MSVEDSKAQVEIEADARAAQFLRLRDEAYKVGHEHGRLQAWHELKRTIDLFVTFALSVVILVVAFVLVYVLLTHTEGLWLP